MAIVIMVAAATITSGARKACVPLSTAQRSKKLFMIQIAL